MSLGIDPTGQRVCAACGDHRLRQFGSSRGFSLFRCAACRFFFVDGAEVDPTTFYDDDYFCSSRGYEEYSALSAIKLATFRRRIAALRPFVADGARALDIGCATGEFTAAARIAGWRALGVDISSAVVAAAQRRHGPWFLRAQGPLLPFRSGAFDVVTMFDFIEHMPAPQHAIEEGARLLRPGGVLVVETPNTAGLSARLMRHHWPLLRPPEHLSYFDARNLSILLARCGFDCLARWPGTKMVTLEYLSGKLRSTNPGLAALGVRVCRVSDAIAQAPFLVPVGSFVLVARQAR
jgi:SAM-dependent methyltransferase